MKFIPILFFVLSASVVIVAQPENSAPIRCGSHDEESQMYDEKLVKVIKIVSGNRILVESGKGPRKEIVTVYLAGIAPNKNDLKLRKFLTAKILNKKITLIGNKEDDDDTEMFAIVRHKGFSELNRQLIESGMADYEEPGIDYSVSNVTMCVYRQELAKAKNRKIGIWAEAPTSK